jgi:outer membrane receptor protein involved in Fe transport
MAPLPFTARDAVAGVINVVTNDKYQGLRFDARYGFADGMSESTGAVRAGIKTKSGGHFTFFRQLYPPYALVRQRTAVFSK